MTDNMFSAWSGRVYGANGVADKLIGLQDEFGLDVNLMLWCCWWGASGRGLLPEFALRKAIDLSRTWTDRVTSPIRDARRALKTPPEAADPGAVGALRESVKAAELEAEYVLQHMLEGVAEAAPDPTPEKAESDARRNLASYAAFCGVAKKPNFSTTELLSVLDDIFSEKTS